MAADSPETRSFDEAHAPRASAAATPAGQAWELIWECGTRLRNRLTSIGAAMGLTPPQLFLLKRIEPGAAVPMSALADQLLCDASNVTGLVDKLESRGLIQRRPDERDRRVKMLVLTEAGVAMRADFLQRMLHLPGALRTLSDAEAICLRDLLQQLLASWPADE